MTTTIPAAQFALLCSGYQRADHCVMAPTSKAAIARKSAAKMIEAGWLKEIKAKSDAPVWRTDDTNGVTYSLKLTSAGLKACAASDTRDVKTDVTPAVPGSEEIEDSKGALALKAKALKTTSAQQNFREGSKLAGVMTLLQREDGVTVDELSVTMGWLPHSTRAVLTGLRKRGILVTRLKTTDMRASAYVVEAAVVGANGQQ